MKYKPYSILSALLLTALMTLLASCSKEESVTLTAIIDDGEEIDEYFILNDSSDSKEIKSAFVTCQQHDSLYHHALLFSEDLVINAENYVRSSNLSSMTWATTTPLSPGQYLAEGVFESLDTATTILYSLYIAEVNAGSLLGEFEATDSDVTGQFSTKEYSCQVVDFEKEVFGKYTTGRIELTKGSETNIHMAISTFCDEFFDNLGIISEVINVIYGGGLTYIDEDREVQADDIPPFSIITLFEESVILGRTYTAYYLSEEAIAELNENPGDGTMEELLAAADQINIIFHIVDTFFTEGEFEGILPDGRTIEGQFRAEIANCN